MSLKAYVVHSDQFDEPWVVAAISEDAASRISGIAARDVGYKVNDDDFLVFEVYAMEEWANSPEAKPDKLWSINYAVRLAIDLAVNNASQTTPGGNK